ncbi:MAG: NUDIX hydrolase [Candidatus Bathyarchaeota archaeon]|nr:NUDIX hydrolase [Candidatus Bathyarchaeota archaeon]
MLHREISVEVEPRCISLWKESWAKRFARATLLVDFGDQFAIVMDASNGFWFLPGGGVEQNESIEETAKREAAEELGLEIKINRIIETFHVTLISRETKEQLKIHPFIVVHATCIGGQLKTEYAPKRKIFLIRREECDNLLRDFEVPEEYECMKPYLYISKETIREFFRH